MNLPCNPCSAMNSIMTSLFTSSRNFYTLGHVLKNNSTFKRETLIFYQNLLLFQKEMPTLKVLNQEKKIIEIVKPNPFIELPIEIQELIFTFLKTREQLVFFSLDKAHLEWRKHFQLPQKLVLESTYPFKAEDWNVHYGEGTVSEEEIKRSIQSLPDNILEILLSPSRRSKLKKTYETDILFFLPEKIKGKVLTIETFNKLFPDSCFFFNEKQINKIFSKTINSGFFLMTTDILTDSRAKSLTDHQQQIVNLNGSSLVNYRFLKPLEAIIGIHAIYFKTKETKFSAALSTQTRCLEGSEGFIVGNFTPHSLNITPFSSQDPKVGLAVIAKLPISK